ncbi:MAG: alpha-amylase family glycosyl hydrolase [Nakamurella sp.]
MDVPHPYAPRPDVRLRHPEWSRDATIYQINTRQFTEEGTFTAAVAHLPRLKLLGVTILWLMPVHQIGELNRKGTLGSPYAVQDYYSVNPDLGTADDLKAFVFAAHELGLRVITDWVANHTAWDCNLTMQHPDWYVRDWQGNFRPTPWWDWDDIIDLDYDNPEVRQYMTEALKWWVTEFDIDGFRCDVAGFVPVDFWNQARRELDEVKPVFMLAEWESRDLHAAAFDMTYGWSWNETMHHIATGHADAEALHVYYSWNEKAWPRDAMRMTFVSNHDKNAWEGTEYEQFGDALDAAIVLSVVGEGMPLIYNGQEAGNDRRLKFFEKDPIVWREHKYADFYRRLFALRRGLSALANAPWGARMIEVTTDHPKRVFAFVRQNADTKVLALFNFTDQPVDVTLTSSLADGDYTDFDSGLAVTVGGSAITMDFEPWGWRVLSR